MTERTRLSRLSRSIEGRVAVVTGAASGMGRATARLFADEGARVAVVDREGEALSALAKEIQEAGGEAEAFVVDLSEREEIAPLVERIAARFAAIDILVNNAGVSRMAPMEQADFFAAWDFTMEVNLTAYAGLVRACLPHLRASDAARIVNVASTEGVGATGMLAAYTASKHGVIGLTRSLAVELGPAGITTNCVCPGPIHTGMTQAIPDAAKDKYARRRVPLRRYGDPEEVAHGTLGLVLPASSYMNGVVLIVDGGMTAKNT